MAHETRPPETAGHASARPLRPQRTPRGRRTSRRPDRRAAVGRPAGPRRGRCAGARRSMPTACEPRASSRSCAVWPRPPWRRAAHRWLPHQAGRPDRQRRPRSDDLPRYDDVRTPPQPGGRRAKLKEGALDEVTFEPGEEVATRRDRPALARRRAPRRPAARAQAPPRGAIIEPDLVRLGAFVRPPIDTWVGSWRARASTGSPSRPPTAATGRANERRMGRQRDAAPLRMVR